MAGGSDGSSMPTAGPASRASAMPMAAFVAIGAAPSVTDLGTLVLLREGAHLPLVLADVAAVSLASVVSYLLHRRSSERTNPYSRWTQAPWSFVVVAACAGAIDVGLLRLAFAVRGFTGVESLVAVKVGALAVAGAFRMWGYRHILSELIVVNRTPGRPTERPPGPRLSVVIPAYREPVRITTTVARLRDELADVAASGGLEIVIVDDGSEDGTDDAALAAGADQVIVLPRNRGKGAAVRAGMLASTGAVVCFTDADLAYDPGHLRELLLSVESGWDVVIGNRRHPASDVARANGLRSLGSLLVNRLAGAVLLAAPADTQCGLKGFRGEVARALFAKTRIDGFAFDIEVLHLVERSGLSLTNLPVRLDETDQPSTVHVLRDVIRLATDLARVRRWSTLGVYDDTCRPGPEDR